MYIKSYKTEAKTGRQQSGVDSGNEGNEERRQLHHTQQGNKGNRVIDESRGA